MEQSTTRDAASARRVAPYPPHIEELALRPDIAIEQDVDLAEASHFRTGGTAAFIISPATAEALVFTIKTLASRGVTFRVLGSTTNVLFLDGVDYSVIVRTIRIDEITVTDDEIVAECGATLPELARRALWAGRKGFAGLEGIPGTVGAGIFMNAGAYGTEIKDTLIAVDLIDAEGKVARVDAEQLGLRHRSSQLRSGGLKGTILRAYFRALPGDREQIYRRMTLCHEKRHRYQEWQYPTLGSIYSSSPYKALGKADRYIGVIMRVDELRRRASRLFLARTPSDRAWVNNKIAARIGIASLPKSYSDKTMNCLVNRGQGTAQMLEYISTISRLTGFSGELENEILDKF